MASRPVNAPRPAKDTNSDIVQHDGKQYMRVKEGLAYILTPDTTLEAPAKDHKGKKSGQATDDLQQVFYNPIQQFNRDLSVLAIKAYGKDALERRQAVIKKTKKNLEVKKNKQEKKKQLEQALAAKQQAASAETAEVKLEAGTETSATLESKKRKSEELESEAGEERPNKIAKITDAATPDAPVDRESEPKSELEAEVEMSSVEKNGHHEGNVSASTDEKPTVLDKDVPMPDVLPEEGATATEDGKLSKPKGPVLRILDALSASGLRALRYAHELPFPVAVTANDMSAAAVRSIELNVQYNGLEDMITASKANAMGHMYSVIAKELSRQQVPWAKTEKYDVIDLDPYGTAANFLDGAVQAVRDDGGLLCVTCTDAGVWASNGYPEKAFALYGGIPMKGQHSHEAGMRIILHGIATSAARYGLTIEPLLSLSIDFYCRIFVRIKKSPASVKFHAGKTMIAYNCDQGCGAWSIQPILKDRQTPNKNGIGHFYKHCMAQAPTAEPHCEHCGSKTHLAGPMWAGYMHNQEFIRKILDDLPSVSTDTYQTTDRIRGMLHLALDELMPPKNGNGDMHPEFAAVMDPEKFDTLEPALIDPVPFSFRLTTLAGAMSGQCPSEAAFRGALIGLGYRTTGIHNKPNHIKTDAPWSVIWDVMRQWVLKEQPIKKSKIKRKSVAWRLLKLDEEEAAEAAGKAEAPAKDDAAAKKREGTTEPAPQAAKRLKLEKIVFNEKLGKKQTDEKLVRYQMNPRENWGPIQRAKVNPKRTEPLSPPQEPPEPQEPQESEQKD